jgi:hypothetical protein
MAGTARCRAVPWIGAIFPLFLQRHRRHDTCTARSESPLCREEPMPRQTRITPCRDRISDRFPVASFVVQLPRERFFEIACATDPRLFHPDHAHERTTRNFLSSRYGGLLRAPAGEATYIVPPQQLKQFAGATRLYYSLGTYRDLRGEDPYFTGAPDQPDQIPCIQIAQDFTARALDRTRFGRRDTADARYGAPEAPLSWGGDAVVSAKSPAGSAAPRNNPPARPEYDDGYDTSLWTRPPAAAPGGGVSPAYGGGSRAPAAGAREFEDGYAQQVASGGRRPAAVAGPARHAADATYGRPPARPASSPVEYEDAPDLARHRAPTSPVRVGGSATAAPAARRASAVSRPFAEAAGPDPSAASSDSAPIATPAIDITLPGRSVEYSDVWGPEAELPVEALRARILSAPQELTPVDRLQIIDVVAPLESGAAGYAAINPDGEFRTPGLAQFQKTHVGLSWGFVQFTQRYGSLGEALSVCARRAPDLFASTFGDDAGELLRVTTAPAEEARLAPVANAALWEEPWLARFAAAGAVPQFQAAQREAADTYFFVPDLPIARWLGFTTDRALAILFDRALHMGRAGGLRWIVSTVGPIRSQKQRDAALAALGFADLAAFARSAGAELGALVGETPAWSAPLHAALVGALRGLGAASPVAIPPLNEMLDTLVRAARDQAQGGDRFWTIAAKRLATLRTTADLGDTPYQV